MSKFIRVTIYKTKEDLILNTSTIREIKKDPASLKAVLIHDQMGSVLVDESFEEIWYEQLR